MDDLTKEFLAESSEGLDRMERCLTQLEVAPGDAQVLAEIFRAVHTIKGTTGFLGFERLEKLAHVGENLLDSLREGRLRADSIIITGLLLLLDRLREILRLVEQTGREGGRAGDEDSELILQLQVLNGDGAALLRPVAPPPPPEHPGEAEPEGERAAAVTSAEKTLRIDVDVLNRMVNLVGELVLTRNRMLQTRLDESDFTALTRRLDSVTVDLRETVMQARMQPVGQVFGKFPRLVRDLARSCGKQVRIEFSGQETGLDKSLLEAIKDPLTHAVRNAIDHGLETPQQRVLRGKPAEGTLSLRAFHQNGSVVIEVADDGGGIEPRRVVEKALERGLLTAEAAAGLSRDEALRLIFLPGFSTAEKITNVSGRGVGMDVVRANVERAGGKVELVSLVGEGTTLRLRVPLTLAIVPALALMSGGQSFCLPQNALLELVYVSAAEAAGAIERMGDATLYRLREALLPLVWLDDLLGIAPARPAAGFYVAVLEGEGCRFALVVDDLLAPEEIVVKPLSLVLRQIGLFSGATMLGSGALALILDVAGLAARAGVRPVSEAVLRGAGMEEEAAQAQLLVFEQGATPERVTRLAIPLGAVERIETVALGAVESVAGRPMLQYRGQVLVLEDAAGMLDRMLPADREQQITVLICQRRRASGRMERFGMPVQRVLDVAAGEQVEDDAEASRYPLALVGERITVVHEADTTAWKEVA